MTSHHLRFERILESPRVHQLMLFSLCFCELSLFIGVEAVQQLLLVSICDAIDATSADNGGDKTAGMAEREVKHVTGHAAGLKAGHENEHGHDGVHYGEDRSCFVEISANSAAAAREQNFLRAASDDYHDKLA